MGPRPCLHLLGGRALVALEEADLKPGWTAEFWVLKADIVDRTRYLLTIDYVSHGYFDSSSFPCCFFGVFFWSGVVFWFHLVCGIHLG